MHRLCRSKVRSSHLLTMFLTLLCATLLVIQSQSAQAHGIGTFQQTRLVSDIKGLARFTDPNLVNSWGLSHSPDGPWVVSDNGAGVATMYQGNGKAVSPVITIPPPKGSPANTTATPTGNVFNNTNGFVVSQGGKSSPSKFIFDTEDGTISGWDPSVDPTNAILEVDRSKVGPGAVYKGLAIAGNFIYATNFRFGTVEQFDTNFNLVRSFTDKKLSTLCPYPGQCFAPFGIQNIKGKLYVTFALQDPDKHDDVAALGNGFVDVFDTNGHLMQRLISKAPLNSPWGLALAPNNFGQFSNDLLVGNFGDGAINAFNPCTGAFIGRLVDQTGRGIDGLWGIAFGNGGQAGPKNTLFFAAGINHEANGLFGTITAK
jgi:uncharacterized protein (TIGR03118 family)